jgi:RsiW-degrading membrane proteinase PrsW (M82 family)
MAQQMHDFFVKFLANPSIVAIGLAVVFGAIWLACYRPPLITKPWLWAVLAAGAVLAPVAIAVAAFPLRFGISLVYGYFWSRETIANWALLASLPSMYLFGLVREGFKLVPVVIYWWRKDKNIEPKLGLAAGAVSGAGFGIIEALWTINYALGSGWSWEKVQLLGVNQLAWAWEGFFILGANVAACALAGWGLAKGRGWQFYLIAALVFVCMNYGTVFVSSNLISAFRLEFIIAAVALLVTGVALWLGERKTET